MQSVDRHFRPGLPGSFQEGITLAFAGILIADDLYGFDFGKGVVNRCLG